MVVIRILPFLLCSNIDFSSTDTLTAAAATTLSGTPKKVSTTESTVNNEEQVQEDLIGKNIFPEIQLRDATSDESFLIQFLHRYESDPLLLQPSGHTYGYLALPILI